MAISSTAQKSEGNNVAVPLRPALAWRAWGGAALLLALVLLLLFGDLLFFGGDRVLSKKGTDLSMQFLHWRAFGFGELAKGNLALWNPHVYGGAPYFGGFQSALLYPPNWLYLVLPLAKAVNVGIVLHLFLAGFFMYLWLGWRRLSFPAAFLGGVLFMLCGPHFLHVYAGHLTNLCAIAWIPLLFLAIDGQFERSGTGWVLLGGAAIGLQLLAGHPQYVYYTGIAAAVYCGLRMAAGERSWRIVAGFAAMNLLALGITAVQWLVGMQATGECVRAGGAAYGFAAMFAFPPENFLTLLAPAVFGSNEGFPYWGRCYLWEMCLFFSITGFVLALRGTLAVPKRERWILLTMPVLLLVLALGRHIPFLYQALYNFLPGFDLFRCVSKFSLLAMLFIILLAAYGLDAWQASGGPGKAVRVMVWVAAGVTGLAGCAFLFRVGAATIQDAVQARLVSGQEFYCQPAQFCHPILFAPKAAEFTGITLVIGAMTFVALGGVLWGIRNYEVLRVRAAWILVGLATLEMMVFVGCYRVNFSTSSVVSAEMREFLTRRGDRDARVLNMVIPHVAMSLGTFEMWGNDPNVTKRYAEFMAFTQGTPPDKASQYLNMQKISPLWRLVRCRALIVPTNDGQIQAVEEKDPLPRFLLVPEWKVVPERDAVFAAISREEFDPRRSVLLERAPIGWPLGSVETEERKNGKTAATAQDKEIENRQSKIEILKESTDWQEVEVTVAKPVILLQTDLYTPNWHVYALPGSTQATYELIPANYILRAVPLQAGTHRLRIEYRPTKFVVGKWVSLASLALFVALVGWWGGARAARAESK